MRDVTAPARPPWVPAATAWTVSLAAHLGVGLLVLAAPPAPDLGFEFEAPSEVEFGLTEAVEVAAAPPAPPPPDPPEPEPESAPGPGEAVPDAGIPDAGPPDAGRRRRRDAGPRDGGLPQVAAVTPERGAGVAFLPAGSQVALRLDMTRMRRSPLAGEIRQFLEVMPDWRALLSGSGIRPLEDLERLLVATPNFGRARIIVAGRAAGGEPAIRAAVDRLAQARGGSPDWRELHGVPVANWHDLDRTRRILALIGPRHFLVCRPQDLPRVLAVAETRALADGEHPADALLSMREGEGLSVEVEGARSFARGRSRSPLQMLPVRLRLAMRDEAQGVSTLARGHYETPQQAQAAFQYWESRRRRYAGNFLVQLSPYGRMVRQLRIATEDERLEARITLRFSELRSLLRLVRAPFEAAASAPREPAPPLRSPGATPAPPRPDPPRPDPPRPVDNPFDP